jgi:carbamoyltransferase
MTAILGISAFYHDAAAALVMDGKIVAAAQEERFTRKKYDASFPSRAIEYCLREGSIDASQIDYVGFYDKPLLKFERLLETYLSYAPAGFQSFIKAMPLWLGKKLHLTSELKRGLGGRYSKRFIFAEHHESHAASAFYPSPFHEAAILTLDGVGEWTTTSYGVGRGNRIELLGEMRFPHSIGLLYSAFTHFAGFRVNSGEYKLMGLAPYGEPKYVDLIYDKLIDLKSDGSFRMAMEYFDYCHGLTMTSRRFDALFGGAARLPEAPITQREMDMAASIQAVTEEIMLRCARHVHTVTNMRNLCLAGGVALNCVANGRISREGPFDRVWIQPAAGDAGGALGVAQLIWYQLLRNERTPDAQDSQCGSMLGPQFTTAEVKACLDAVGARYRALGSEDQLCDEVADLIAQEKVVGWFQGRMEFGPRALGGRSILGDPRSSRMQSVMNLKIKFRESFRPFAPSILEEAVADYFEMRVREQSPYMLVVAPVQKSRRLDVARQSDAVQGFDKLKVQRSQIPAVTHVDYSARVQTVDAERHGRYYKLISRFRDKTMCPLLINTSFNIRGEPIVGSPADAYRCFMATDIDALVIETFILRKDEQPALPNAAARDYVNSFALD